MKGLVSSVLLLIVGLSVSLARASGEESPTHMRPSASQLPTNIAVGGESVLPNPAPVDPMTGAPRDACDAFNPNQCGPGYCCPIGYQCKYDGTCCQGSGCDDDGGGPGPGGGCPKDLPVDCGDDFYGHYCAPKGAECCSFYTYCAKGTSCDPVEGCADSGRGSSGGGGCAVSKTDPSGSAAMLLAAGGLVLLSQRHRRRTGWRG